MATSFKEEIELVKRRLNIFTDEEAKEAIEFASAIMDIQIQQTEKDEPYAKNWIGRAEETRRMIDDLPEFYEDQMKL